ncbi:MAG: NUDIX hydrolase [Pseudomonadota bacterium]
MASPWPQLGVGAIVVHEGCVLLVRRARAPAEGLWAIPGGRVEPGERLHEAVARELMEETGVRVAVKALAWQFEFVEREADGSLRFHYVVLDYHADYLGGELRAGDDASEARWVPFGQLRQLALTPSTEEALASLFAEKLHHDS